MKVQKKAEKVFADNASTIAAPNTLHWKLQKQYLQATPKEWKINGEAVTIRCGKENTKAQFVRRGSKKMYNPRF